MISWAFPRTLGVRVGHVLVTPGTVWTEARRRKWTIYRRCWPLENVRIYSEFCPDEVNTSLWGHKLGEKYMNTYYKNI